MKKYLRIFILLMGTFTFCEKATSQHLGECGTENNFTFSGDAPKGINCTNTGTDYLTKYRTPQHWIPDNSTPIKTVLVNYVICQDDTGGNAWIDSPALRDQIDAMFYHLNLRYSNSLPKGYALTCEPNINYITDTRIRFELKEIIFLQNSVFNKSCTMTEGDAIMDHLHQFYPNSKTALNHIFTLPDVPPPSYCPTTWWGYYGVRNNHSYVFTKGSMYSDWFVVWDAHINHIAHEYGHALGLHHTYNSERTQISHYDFLDDVFGTCAEPSMQDPANPCFADCGQQGALCACTPQTGHVCYLHCFFTGSINNPLMSGGPEVRYISPKSAGRMHRALSLFSNDFVVLTNKPMHQYVKERYPYSVPKEITSNETWDFAIKMYQNIVVKAGNTLTITCEVRMPIDGKIIVERGGKLIIDGGTITCGWNSLWHGIEVWGTKSASQLTSSAQGEVIIKNGAVIENAREAITTIKNTNGNLDWSYTGGVVTAHNSTFLNCRRAMQFLSYQNFIPTNNNPLNNRSLVKNCIFETTVPVLNDGVTNPNAFITMFDVQGVGLVGNTFRNTTPIVGGPALIERGSGIISVDAKYRTSTFCPGILQVGQTCPNPERNSFENLFYGIRALATNPLNTIIINDAIFDNNFFGVYISGIDYPTVTNNNFNVSNIFTNLVPQVSYGLYLDNSTAYKVEANNFYSTYNGFVGVYINNSLDAANAIYNNTFTDLVAGSIALNDNDGPDLADGLKINCNDYVGSNMFDIAIMSQGNPNTDIGAIQGLCTGIPLDLVRNRYGALCSGNENQYYVDKSSTQAIVHHNHPGVIYEPQCKDAFVAVTPCNNFINFDKLADCPSTLDCGFPCLKERSTGLVEKIRNLNLIIDGDKTSYLLQQISSGGSPGALKNLLLSYSPYLSDEVLIAVINRTNPPLLAGVLKEILMANSPLTAEVIAALDNRIVPVPNGIRNEINNVQTGISEREKLEREIALNESKQELVINDRIRLFLNDTIMENPMDSVIAILKEENRKNAKCQLTAAYLSKEDFVKAQQMVDSLQIVSELDNFCKLQSVLIELYQTQEGCFKTQTDSLARARVEEVANDPSRHGCANAQAVLAKVFETRFPEETLLPDNGGGNRMNNFSQNGNNATIEDSQTKPDISCFPNPARESVTFTYTIPAGAVSASIMLYDIRGKLVNNYSLSLGEDQLDIKSDYLNNGVFFYVFVADDKPVSTGKLVIIK